MPRFHFNSVDGDIWPDEDGTLLPGIEAAHRHALQFTGELLQGAKTLEEVNDFTMLVTDEDGRALFSISVLASHEPAVRPSSID